VHDAHRVHRLEAARGLLDHVRRLRRGERASLEEDAVEVDAVHQLHHHETARPVLAVLVDRAHVGVAHAPRQPDLVEEPSAMSGERSAPSSSTLTATRSSRARSWAR